MSLEEDGRPSAQATRQVPFVDADQHYYEPYDCFSRHIETKYSDRAVHAVKHEDGIGRVYVGDRRLRFLPSWHADYTGSPGSLNDFYEGRVTNRSDMIEGSISAWDYPELMNKGARLELNAREGVRAAIMLPTTGVGFENDLRHEPDVLYANVRAFNRWVEEDWGFGDDGVIFGVPVLSLVDVEQASTELDRLLARGARLIYMRPGHLFGQSPADVMFNPVWARLNEARVPIVYHLGDGDAAYTESFSSLWGEAPNPPVHLMSGFQWFTCNAERPITDTIASLIFRNLFGRFPDLRVLSIENGSSWVAPALKGMDKAFRQTYGRTVAGRHQEQMLTELPSEIFNRHVWINPFVEEDVAALAQAIPAERVICGSDYPHPEGVASPGAYAGRIKTETAPDVAAKLLCTNLATVLGIPV